MVKSYPTEVFSGLHGLRGYAAIGICLMHVYTNMGSTAEGFCYDYINRIFPDLVFLFMMISGFSMCCGYYDRVSKGEITPTAFYAKRFSKIWPFFAFLNLLDMIVHPEMETLYQIIANLTLCYGLLPNPRIQVIGVGWTLGVIFVFYLLFPFVCFLLANKRRAWLSFLTAAVMQYLCRVYFFDSNHVIEGFSGRSSFAYCAVYFLAGGLIWLYREQLTRVSKWVWLPALVGGIVAFWFRGILPLVFALLLIFGIGYEGVLLNNRVSRFMSRISMEFYLSHMVVYRVIEKAGISKAIAGPHAAYWVTALLTILGTVAFSVAVGWGVAWVRDHWKTAPLYREHNRGI